LAKNRVVLACAGARKTTSVVEEALAAGAGRVLIMTYTNENRDQVESFLYRRVGHVPPNITVTTWYSFLLHDCIRPYQHFVLNSSKVEGIDFQTQNPPRVPATRPRWRYLNHSHQVYRERAAELAMKCEVASGGRLVRRIERIYSHIFIDEFQDLAGYDWNLVECFLKSSCRVIAVGDPRQAIFATNRSQKNKQYRLGGVVDWVNAKNSLLFTVEVRNQCYRCNQAICDFADSIYPELPKTVSKNTETTVHDGMFAVSRREVAEYVKTHAPTVLRYNRTSDTLGFPAQNIGVVKGRTFDRVLLFPTKPMLAFWSTRNPERAGSREKLYIAVTRARFSVGIVVD
jgi:hypothetical protein